MAEDLNITSPELKQMEIPQELKTLLSCSLCGRDYDLFLLLPKMLECKHAFCADCTEGRLVKTQSVDRVICAICERHSTVGPQPESLLFLLAQMPALKLGRAMLMNHAASEGRSPRLPSGGNQPSSSGRRSQSVSFRRGETNARPTNWIDEISMENFLMRSSSEHCPVHAMPHTIWCHNCQIIICRACAELQPHIGHRLTRQLDFDELLRQLFSNELAKIEKISERTTQFANREMRMWHQLCEICSLVQLRIKRQIMEHKPTIIACQMRVWRQRTERDLVVGDAQHGTTEMLRLLKQLNEQKSRFQDQLNEVQFQCQLKALIYDNGLEILDFKRLNQRVLELRQPQNQTYDIPLGAEPPPILVLTNYCIYSYWKEVQSHFAPITRMNRMNAQQTELVPQYRQAVVLPNVNQRQREREAMRRMVQEQQNYERQLQQHTRSYAYCEDINRDQISHASGRSSNTGSPSTSTTSSSTCTNPAAQLFEDNNYNCLNLDQQLPQRGSNPDNALNSPYWALYVQRTLHTVLSPNPQAEEEGPDSAPAAADVEVADVEATASAAGNAIIASIPLNPTAPRFPIYFLDIEIARNSAGRVLIEVRNDVAPRMAENFHKLILHERGFGYRGCSIFQAWNNAGIITGDFEYHNGRGGHAALVEDSFFMPDNTRLHPQRGTVGMRSGHRIYDNNSFVGSQFRLILNEYCPFTAIFGRVLSGIELVERIAASGDSIGRPGLRSFIKNCGIYRPQ
ncbi:uncharacterized protein [Drosophila tropicalis]|uniref:uncharacterized protein n=1 Tax=Drosophila tropicalis TaxID=46794 RepID=UPI0035AC1FFD